MDPMQLFVPLAKFDAVSGEFSGVLAAEVPDHAGEILDYAKSKPHFKAWSDGFLEKTEGKSAGNLRVMHKPEVAGKFTEVAFDDVLKQVVVKGKVVDPVQKQMLAEGCYTGLSVGGSYIEKAADGKLTRYTAGPSEGSLVDSPCIPTALLQVRKDGGALELLKFRLEGEGDAAKVVAEKVDVEGVSDDGWLTEAALEKVRQAAEKPVLAKDAGAAEAAGDAAIEALRALVAELALMEGDPETWALQDAIDAIRSAIWARDAARFSVDKKLDVDSLAKHVEAVVGAFLRNMGADEDARGEVVRKAFYPVEVTLEEAAAVDLEPVTKAIQSTHESIDKLGKLLIAQGEASQASAEEGVKALADAKDELGKTIAALAADVEKLKAMPAPAGRQVRKTLGTPSIDDSGPNVNDIDTMIRAAEEAGAQPDVIRKMRMAAAEAAMPR